MACSGLNTAIRSSAANELVAVGSPVRRFLERRADHHRPVHRRVRGQMAAAMPSRDAPAARLRRPGTRTLVRAARTLSAALRREQSAGLLPDDAGTVFSSAAPAGKAGDRPAADRDDAKEPAASAGRDSTMDELTTGGFQPVIDDACDHGPNAVKRVVLCSGKVFYDLDAADWNDRATTAWNSERRRSRSPRTVLPFPGRSVDRDLRELSERRQIIWTQEEPQNMGGWTFVENRIRALLPQVPSSDTSAARHRHHRQPARTRSTTRTKETRRRSSEPADEISKASEPEVSEKLARQAT